MVLVFSLPSCQSIRSNYFQKKGSMQISNCSSATGRTCWAGAWNQYLEIQHVARANEHVKTKEKRERRERGRKMERGSEGWRCDSCWRSTGRCDAHLSSTYIKKWGTVVAAEEACKTNAQELVKAFAFTVATACLLNLLIPTDFPNLFRS